MISFIIVKSVLRCFWLGCFQPNQDSAVPSIPNEKRNWTLSLIFDVITKTNCFYPSSHVLISFFIVSFFLLLPQHAFPSSLNLPSNNLYEKWRAAVLKRVSQSSSFCCSILFYMHRIPPITLMQLVKFPVWGIFKDSSKPLIKSINPYCLKPSCLKPIGFKKAGKTDGYLFK